MYICDLIKKACVFTESCWFVDKRNTTTTGKAINKICYIRLFMVLKMITVKISPNQIFTIFVLEMDDKFNKFILEGWKCRCWMAIDNTNNKTFAR